MKRRINWQLGDSSPVSAHGIFNVSGGGTLKIAVGFPPSAATVAFAKQYDEDTFGYDPDLPPEVFVSDLDETGFTVTYVNIPDRLEINYYAH
jgi:hypothetical protein